MVTHRRPPSVWGAVVGSVISKMVGVSVRVFIGGDGLIHNCPV